MPGAAPSSGWSWDVWGPDDRPDARWAARSGRTRGHPAGRSRLHATNNHQRERKTRQHKFSIARLYIHSKK